VKNPNIKIKPSVQPGKVYFDIMVTVKAEINELHQEMSERELIDLAEQEIEKQIRDTYRQGVERKVDVFNLGEPLFRHNPSAWHRLADKDQYILREDSLRNVRIVVHLTHTGRYKFKPGM
jgi:spore germination protein KC